MTAIRVNLASIEEGTEGVIKRLKSTACKSWRVVCGSFKGRKVWLDDNGKIFCYVGREYVNRLKVYLNGKLVEVV